MRHRTKWGNNIVSGSERTFTFSRIIEYTTYTGIEIFLRYSGFFPQVFHDALNHGLRTLGSSEASSAFGYANANLNHHYSFLKKLILIRSINTEKFAFA